MSEPDPLYMWWSVQPNDEGGWCIRTAAVPPSAGYGTTVADVCSKEIAEHLVELHNMWCVKATFVRTLPVTS